MTKNFFYVILIRAAYSFFFILTSTFSGVFFYEFFEGNLFYTMLPISIGYTWFGTISYLFSGWTAKLGTRNSLVIGVILFLCTIPTGYLFTTSQSVVWLAVWMFFNYSGKLFFIVPMIYLTNMYIEPDHAGNQIAQQQIVTILVFTLAPLLGGLAADYYGFFGLFLAGAGIFVAALLPIMLVKNHHYKLDLSRLDILSDTNNFKFTLINSTLEFAKVGRNLWPILIFISLGSSFVRLGELITLGTILSIFLIYWLGRYIDHHRENLLLKKLQAINSATLVIASLVSSLVGFLALDSFLRLSKNLVDSSWGVTKNSLIGESEEDINYRDERVVMQEISIGFTVGIISLIFGGIGELTNIRIAIAVAGIASLMIVLLPSKYFKS